MSSLETVLDPAVDSVTPSEFGARAPLHRWSRSSQSDLVLLITIAISARLLLWIIQPGAWYFSDSGDYIATFGWKPYSANRSPALAWLWHVGGAFNYTERNVVLLQITLGVVSVVLLYDLLRRIVSRNRALFVAVVWSVFPLALIFERTLMPESMGATLLIFLLWLASVAFSSPWERWRAVPAVFATFVASLICVIIPSLELACAVIVVILLIFAWRSTSAMRGCQWGIVARGSLVASMVFGFCVPVLAVAIENQDTFGTFAVHPTSGTYLFARWFPLVSCHPEGGLTTLVKASVNDLCGKPFTSVPGENENEIWTVPALNGSLWHADLGATQHQLTNIAEHAMLAHPGTVIWQVSDSLLYQLFMPPYDDLYRYNNGYKWMVVSSRPSDADTLANWQHWWGTTSKRVPSRVPVFQTIAQLSYRWPQFLIWALLSALVVRVASRIFKPARWRSNVEDSGTTKVKLGTWTKQPRLAVVTASSILIVGSLLSVAVAGFPVFRYQVTLVPALLVLLAVATQFHWNDKH